jgi:SulP family sulfate permease
VAVSEQRQTGRETVAVSERRQTGRVFASLVAGVVIGAVEVVLAISFAALVFGGYLVLYLGDGIGLYLVAGSVTLALIAWRAGKRGVIGSVQDAAAAIISAIALSTVLAAKGSSERVFLTVIATTMVVTLLAGVAFFVLGAFKLGNLVRFVPYPVVGGFLAGTGWLLTKGGIGVAAGVQPTLDNIHELFSSFMLARWIPALAFGVILYGAARILKRPIVIPAVLGLGLVLFAVGILVTGNSIDSAQQGSWMLGPFPSGQLWHPWTFRALSGADWSGVLEQTAAILTAVFVAVIAALFNVSGVELLLRTDLDSNRELRDLGTTNVIGSTIGGIPAYHAVSLSSMARQMNAGARVVGFVAALIPLAAVIVGASLIELIPRFLVGGVLVFVGLAFLVEWVIDVRRSLPLGEYAIVLAILVTIAAKGILTGVEVGLVLAIVLFAVNYSRIELIREVGFGSTYRSNVDRPAAERQVLDGLADRVMVLRVNGFVFFGSASGLLERIRKRVEAGPPLRFLVIDMRRVTGMDSSAVLSFRKITQLAHANGFELVLSGVPDRVRAQLQRGGVGESEGVVRFEPDLDRGLQRCEDGLLDEAHRAATGDVSGDGLASLPKRLSTYLQRESIPEGTVLIRQGDEPDDLFVLESGRLAVELTTPEGSRVRLRSMRSGVVVGEIAMYMKVPRTADVVAETPCVVQRLTRASIDRMEAAEPEVAAALHRWLARTLAERLNDTLRAFDAMRD